jgi:hypothetical protein
VRVLAPGGSLALSVWDAPARMRLTGVLVDAIAEVSAAPATDVPSGPDAFRFADEHEFERLLTRADFSVVAVETFEFTHRFGDVSEYWHALLGGSVRTAALVRSQTHETQKRIRRVFEVRAARYAIGGGLELPAAVKIGSGR